MGVGTKSNILKPDSHVQEREDGGEGKVSVDIKLTKSARHKERSTHFMTHFSFATLRSLGRSPKYVRILRTYVYLADQSMQFSFPIPTGTPKSNHPPKCNSQTNLCITPRHLKSSKDSSTNTHERNTHSANPGLSPLERLYALPSNALLGCSRARGASGGEATHSTKASSSGIVSSSNSSAGDSGVDTDLRNGSVGLSDLSLVGSTRGTWDLSTIASERDDIRFGSVEVRLSEGDAVVDQIVDCIG